MKRLWMLALLVTAAAQAVPSAPSEARPSDRAEAPSVRTPLPFDHPAHARSFERAGLSCVDCHPVGLRPNQALPPPPRSSCHGCHLGELPGAPKQATRVCTTCHAHRAELVPASHGPGWEHAHGAEARARGATCSDCHRTSTCVDCHEARGAGQRNPHPPAFRTTHGVEARLDPARCSTCHTGNSCQTCHTTGALPW